MKKQITDENREIKTRKTFTIVLIIMIIAIFFGAFVPLLWIYVTQNGASEDLKLVKELNAVLELDQGEHNTMTDVLSVAEKAGFDVSKINANKMHNEILWDSKNDVFVYYNADSNKVDYVENTIYYHDRIDMNNPSDVPYLWKICEEVPEQNFSMYWIGNVNEIPEEIHSGFDSGKNEVKKDVNYVNETEYPHNVVIRTNSRHCNINVNAPLDTVSHYDRAKKASIFAIAAHSYHEYGEVELIAIANGRVVLDGQSDVRGIHFSAQDTDDDGYNDNFQEIIIQLEGQAKIPTFYRDPVVIADNGTLVCELQTEDSDSEYIWLAKQGIYEQIMLSDNDESPQEWVSTSDSTDFSKQVSQDIANVVDYEEVEIDEETRDIIVEPGQEVEVLIEDKGKTEEEAETIIDVQVSVEAIVSEHITTTEDLITLYTNTQFATQAAIDTAYRFDALSKEDQVYVDAFLSVKENGKPIFTNNIDDYSNKEKINKALDILGEEKGEQAKARVEEILRDKLPYIYYRADYEISFDRDIEAGSVALAGYYANFAEQYYDGQWLGFGVSDFDENMTPKTLKANKSLRLLDTAYNFSHNEDFHMNYGAILGYVKSFSCGFANLSDVNEGATLTVTLNLYEMDEEGNETGNKIECGKYKEVLQKVSAVNRAIIGQ